MIELRSRFRNATPLALAMTGLVVWLLGALALWRIRGPVNFVDRDDGIITLAHAQNLVDIGSVSVGAFGDRVAGFSSPLHFLVGLVFYGLGGDGYEVLDRIVGLVCLVGIGAGSGWVVASELGSSKPAMRWAALALTAVLQLGSWSFFGWQFSGMENPLVAVLLVLVVAAAPLVPRSTMVAFGCGVMLGLLTIARLDTVTVTAPMTLVLLIGLRPLPSKERWARSLALIAPIVAVVALTGAAWLWYFGGFESTTVENRSRDLATLRGLLAAAGLALVGAVALTKGAADGLTTRRRVVGVITAVVGVACLALTGAVVASVENGPSTETVMHALLGTGAIAAGLAAVASWAILKERSIRWWTITVVILWVPTYAILLGPTRIHPARVVSTAVPVLALAVVIVGVRLWERYPGVGRVTVAALLVAGFVVPEVVLTPESTYFRSFYLGWAIEPRNTLVVETAARTVAEVDPRITPIVANADLGKVAFSGAAQIVDLGKIGDPLLLKILVEPPGPVRTEMSGIYLFDVMPPDTWLLTDPWSCGYRGIVNGRRFEQRYRRLEASTAGSADGDFNAPSICNDGKPAENGLFTLRNPAEEPDLLLARQLLDRRVDIDNEFFEPCRVADPDECFLRFRAFRRAFPGAGPAKNVADHLVGLDQTAHGRLARALILSPLDPAWSEEAFGAIRELATQ